jgi:peptidoglycan/LPS O-acetylase OafA/YrhL
VRSGSAAALAALALLWVTAGMRSAWLYEGGLAVAGVSAAVAIASVVAAPESLPARLLSRRPVVRIGRLSYSLYLWHWPVHVYATHAWARLGRPLMVTAELAVTLVLGAASFALIETPTRRIRRPVALAAPLLACGLLVLAGTVYARPAPPAEQQTGVVVHGRP